MTHYRPSEALCHWRHLTVIATEANVNGVAVADEDVNAATREVLVASCQEFTRLVIDFSDGMCWMQNDIFWVPTEWTLGTHSGGGVYVTGGDQVITGCDAVGKRVLSYDSYSFLGPDLTYTSPFSGLSYGNGGDRTYYAWMQYALTWGDPGQPDVAIPYLSHTMAHEWGHTVDFYFDEAGLGVTMPHPDNAAAYRHLDNTALDSEEPDLSMAFLQAMWTGNIEDIATSTAQGCTAAVWALGPPRKTYPR